MSESGSPGTFTQPRGLPLGYLSQEDSHGIGNGRPDAGENLRSQLMWTIIVAVVLVVSVAAGGAIAIELAWYSSSLISIAVAAGSVVISIVALGRAFFLSRSLRPTPRAAGRHSAPDARLVQPAAAEQPRAEPRQPPQPPRALPPLPAPAWMDAADFESVTSGNSTELRQEVFGKLAYRLQSLVHRLIHRIDQVEQEIEDPELLKSLYAIDHLATRIRRQIENLAVLGGEAPQRRSDIPVEVNAVLRAAVAEIEHYKQVTTVPIHDAKIHGHVVAEVIHLLAELLENATTFTAKDAPKVMLRAHRVTAGLAIEVQDRGIGMPIEDIRRLNRVLDGSTRVDVVQLLQDGRIGLAVVEILARRHNIAVELQPNIFGGTDASIVIHHSLLNEREREPMPRSVLPAPAAPDRSVAAGGGTERRAALPPRPSTVLTRTAPATAAPAHAAQAVPANPAAPHDQARSSGPLQAPSSSQPLPAPAPRDDGAESSFPALPVRTRGEHYELLRSGVADPTGRNDDLSRGTVDAGLAEQLEDRRHDGQASAADPADRPMLPQRRGSHLREELREPPAPARPIPGHNPTLMAALQEGRARGRAEHGQHAASEPDAARPREAHESTEGDSASWPT